VLLLDHLDTLMLERSLDSGTEANYRRSIRFFGDFLGRPVVVSDLVEIEVNRWLKSLEPTKAARTVIGHKRAITVVWNWLADQNLTARYESRRLRKVKAAKNVPVAWSLPNVRALLEGAKRLVGRLRGGIAASDLMTAWVLVAYESGLRPGDLRLLAHSQMGDRNQVSVVQHKTGQRHSFTLTDYTVEAIRKIQRVGSDRVFPASRNTIRRWELRLFAAAEAHGFIRRRGQGLGTLRKTHGTEVCRTQGLEAAASSLGHIGGTAIAREYYVSPDALPVPKGPPSLFDADDGTKTNPSDHRRRTSGMRRTIGCGNAPAGSQPNRRNRAG
jgi:site-specific recombinase XerD